MTSRTHPARRGDGLSPTDPRLIGDPLEFIAADHQRIRLMCAEMDRLAAATRVDAQEAAAMLSFLTEELPLLLADEDEVLLPLLMRRSTHEDDMPRLKVRLNQEHARIVANLPEVTEAFSALAETGGAIGEELICRLSDFAADMRRHLILENAILLPFARLRLTARDLETLTRRMLARRGLDRLIERDDAQ